MAGGPITPSPQCDVVEEVPQCENGGVDDRCRHRPVPGEASPPGAGAVPDQELLDVDSFEVGQSGHVWVVLGQERPERDQVVDEPIDR